MIANTKKSPVNISLIPNPASHHFSIKTSEKLYSISVFDINGSLLLRVVDTFEQIPIDAFSNGVYWVALTTSSGIQNIQKLVVMK